MNKHKPFSSSYSEFVLLHVKWCLVHFSHHRKTLHHILFKFPLNIGGKLDVHARLHINVFTSRKGQRVPVLLILRPVTVNRKLFPIPKIPAHTAKYVVCVWDCVRKQCKAKNKKKILFSLYAHNLAEVRTFFVYSPGQFQRTEAVFMYCTTLYIIK